MIKWKKSSNCTDNATLGSTKTIAPPPEYIKRKFWASRTSGEKDEGRGGEKKKPGRRTKGPGGGGAQKLQFGAKILQKKKKRGKMTARRIKRLAHYVTGREKTKREKCREFTKSAWEKRSKNNVFSGACRSGKTKEM